MGKTIRKTPKDWDRPTRKEKPPKKERQELKERLREYTR